MFLRFSPLILFICLLAGCSNSPERLPAIGTAYAGPASLPIRQEINPRSSVVATVHHGDRLEIVQQRRRFLKVRTPQGIEGWTDERMLLDEAQVKGLKQLSANVRHYPSQGQAVTFETLNIHTDPQRQSPSYLQIKEGERVDVIEHRLAPHEAPPRKPLVLAAPKIAKRASKKPSKARVSMPPTPAPPPPPPDWIDISKTRAPTAVPEENKPPVGTDDWTLVRKSSGESGWVLTRLLSMAIPDEVAQYAEGRRITSYFSLGKIRDADKIKDIWLWTTIEHGAGNYDFDGYRVFVWSLRHHRYETAYIQRRVPGFFPTLVQKVNGRTEFSVCLEKGSGGRVRKSYVLLENVVRPAGEKPCTTEDDVLKEEERGETQAQTEHTGRSSTGIVARVKRSADALRKKWFGK